MRYKKGLPEANSQPPEVQEILERPNKKSKRERPTALPMQTVEAELPTTPMTESPMTDGNQNPAANYKDTLRNPRQFDLDGIPEEVESDNEDTTKEFDPECPRIVITKEEKARIRRPWRRTLIIKLLGKTIGYNLLLRRLEAMWKLESPMELIDLDQDYFLARFEAQRDYDYARFEGPWMIFDHYLIVQEWMPNFNPQTNKIERILAWVKECLLCQ